VTTSSPSTFLTCRSDHLAVPAVSALQQIAAEAYAFGNGPKGRRALVSRVRSRKTLAIFARPRRPRSSVRVDGAVVEAADVEQQTRRRADDWPPSCALPNERRPCSRWHAHSGALRPRRRCRELARSRRESGPAEGHSTLSPDGPSRIPPRRGSSIFRRKANHCVPLISHSGFDRCSDEYRLFG